MISHLRFSFLRQFSVVSITFLLSSMVIAATYNQSAPVFTLEKETLSEDGHIKIEWNMDQAGADVELQQAEDKLFDNPHVIYRGPDNATFVSGLEDGTYYFRVRKLEGPWSEVITVNVKHHSLQVAFILFGLGAIVFAMTVFVVVRGAVNSSVD